MLGARSVCSRLTFLGSVPSLLELKLGRGSKPFCQSRAENLRKFQLSFRTRNIINNSTDKMSDGLGFIDIGANLLDSMYNGVYNEGKSYHPPDLDAVLARAWDSGLRKIIITAGNLEGAKAALQLARTDERLFCTVGVHPTRCTEFEEYAAGPEAYLAALAGVVEDGLVDNKVIAIGECGLDNDRTIFCDAPTQSKWFSAQFSLARKFNLPMFFHLRSAAQDFMSIVRRHQHDFPAGIVHSFDGSVEELEDVLSLSKLHIGLNGCSLKAEHSIRHVVPAIPADRLHLETDAPWCEIRTTHAGSSLVQTRWPAKDRKKHDAGCLVKGRNEPCNIRQVFEVVSSARGIVDERGRIGFAKQILKNTEQMYFSLKKN